VRLLGVLERLSGKFVTRLVILLAVLLGGSTMRLRGEIVELGGNLV